MAWRGASVWLVLGAGVVATVGAGLASRPEILVVERVRFEGHHHASEPALRHLAGIRNGSRVWEVDPGRVSGQVQRHPWVKRATTTRTLAGQVKVEVQENDPVALVRWHGKLYYVDRGGWPFMEASPGRLDLPLILGLGPEIDRRDPAIAPLVVRDALWLLDQLDARRLLPRDWVSDVTFDFHRGLTVRTTTQRSHSPPSEILFGFDRYDVQLRKLARLLEEDVDLTQGMYIDLAPASTAIVRPVASSAETGEGEHQAPTP